MTQLTFLLITQSAVWISAQEFNVSPRFEITEASIVRDKENTVRAIVDDRKFRVTLQNLLDRKRVTPDGARFDAREATRQLGAFERKYQLTQELSNEGTKIKGTVTRTLGTKSKSFPIDAVLPIGRSFALVFTDVDGQRKLVLLSLAS